MANSREKTWVETLQPILEAAVAAADVRGIRTRVRTGYRLPYLYEIHRFQHEADTPADSKASRYETDLLIYDERSDKEGWVPRVIVECKVASVTTHDALTYSAKAATHKHVHPYLRYGILIGSYGDSIPARLVRHGAYFDFMGVWNDEKATKAEWTQFVHVVLDEIRASRTLQDLLTNRTKKRSRYKMLHRPLILESSSRKM